MRLHLHQDRELPATSLWHSSSNTHHRCHGNLLTSSRDPAITRLTWPHFLRGEVRHGSVPFQRELCPASPRRHRRCCGLHLKLHKHGPHPGRRRDLVAMFHMNCSTPCRDPGSHPTSVLLFVELHHRKRYHKCTSTVCFRVLHYPNLLSLSTRLTPISATPPRASYHSCSLVWFLNRAVAPPRTYCDGCPPTTSLPRLFIHGTRPWFPNRGCSSFFLIVVLVRTIGAAMHSRFVDMESIVVNGLRCDLRRTVGILDVVLNELGTSLTLESRQEEQH